MTRFRRTAAAVLAGVVLAVLPGCSSDSAEKKVDKASEKAKQQAKEAKKKAEKAKKDAEN